MRARPATPADERLALLDGLIYADVFDCALTLEELCRYSRVPADPESLGLRLEDDDCLRGIVTEQGGFYCLSDRPGLIDERPRRMRRARRLERRARRVARMLRQLPFVRGLELTGSVAANDAGSEADVDLLVIIAAGRLSTGFVILGSLSRLLGRRLFCPNYYLSETDRWIAPGNVYVARELVQARSLFGDPSILRGRNRWLTEVFPNAGVLPDRPLEPHGNRFPQRRLEAPLTGALGDRVERWARRVAVARLHAHYRQHGEDVPTQALAGLESGIALRFHGGRMEQAVLARYADRRAQVEGRLEQLDREPGSAELVSPPP